MGPDGFDNFFRILHSYDTSRRTKADLLTICLFRRTAIACAYARSLERITKNETNHTPTELPTGDVHNIRDGFGLIVPVHSPFQNEGFHRLFKRLKNSNQTVVLPREVTLPGAGDLPKGTTV
jgi:hypothetical protein